MGAISTGAVLALVALSLGVHSAASSVYYGRLIGSLDSRIHGLRGDVYAVDARTLFVKGFSFDGHGQDTVFLGGSSPKSGADGFVIPNESGSTDKLAKTYDNQDLTLTLPEGKTLKEVRWLTLFNRADSESLAEVKVPAGFDYPRPQRLNALNGIHRVSSDRVYVVDAQTFLIPNFTYDGAAPDAFFWVGQGNRPTSHGIKVPDENGKGEPLRQYDSKTLVLTLPGDLTVFDVDWISIWCQAFEIDFGHIRIPKNLNVPPSLKMLGVAPQAKLNCEVLWDDLALEIRWAVAGETIVLQLVGKIDDGHYVAFGPSGDPKRTRMIGADIALGWLDRQTGKGFVQDYYATSKSQCNGGKGVCQDASQAGGVNNIRLLNAALVNEYVMLTYQRPLKAQDEFDRSIITNGTQSVIWAVGSINANGEPAYHKLRNKGDLLIDFGRSPFWNCPAPEEPHSNSPTQRPGQSWTSLTEKAQTQAPLRPTAPPAAPLKSSKLPKPWFIPPIECHEPENHVFYAHIGPSGGAQGYHGITGNIGWNIGWYVNGLLVPEITVIRGETYTFVVEGGQDPDRPARHHPFYITDDPEGGYEFKTPAERSRARVFAGVTFDRDGNPAPSASGRLCEWVEDPAHPADAFSSFGAYQRTLKLHCEEGQPAILQWTPDASTPDTVYYQCYTHRFLGWKIRVVNRCDALNNRKQLDISSAGIANHAPGQITHESTADSREGIDYDQEYYDDEPNGAVATFENDRVDKHQGPNSQRRPPSNDPSFFGDSAFPHFPSFPEDIFGKKTSLGRQETTSRPVSARPTAASTRPSTRSPTQPPTQPPTRSPTQPPTRPPTAAPTVPTQAPHPTRPSSKNVPVEPFNFPPNRPREPYVLTNQPQDKFDVNVKSDMKVGHDVEDHRPHPQPHRPFGFLSKGQVKGVPVPSNGDRSERFDDVRPLPPNYSEAPFIRHSPTSAPNKLSSLLAPFRQPSPVQYGPGTSAPINKQYRPFGFDPTTVVLESGFKPIRKADGPVPPLGFEVEEDEETEIRSSNDYAVLVGSDRPALVPLDPVFIPSDPDHLLSKNRNPGPVPVQLPEAVVPVVPGRPQQQPQPPALRRPGPPPPQANNQRPNQPPQRQAQPPKPPRNKATNALSSFFGFGSNRRQQKPGPNQSRPQQPQQQQRRPLPPGHQALREQGGAQQPQPQQPQPGQPPQHPQQQLHDPQRQHQLPEDVEPNQGNGNQVNPNHPPLNRLRQQKPQRLSTLKLLKRLLQGDRRQDVGENHIRPGQKGPKVAVDQAPQASQIGANAGQSAEQDAANLLRRPGAKPGKNPKMPPRGRPGQPQPAMTFQGPLPPIIVNRNKKANRKSDRPGPVRGNVLDPISAQIIGGVPIQGVHHGVQTPVKAEDRMHVERFLFGAGESARALGSADIYSDELPIQEPDNEADEDGESSTDLPGDYSEYHDYTEDEENHENDVNEEESDDGADHEEVDGDDEHLENHQEGADNHENHQSENHENHQPEHVGNPAPLVGHEDDSEQATVTQEHDEHEEENHHIAESQDHKSSSEELGLLLTDVEGAHGENSSALAILKDIISNMNKEAMKNSESSEPALHLQEAESKNRTKRQADDVSQHLDEDPDKIASKDLPVEHRGFDDEEYDDAHDHSAHNHPHPSRKSNGSATSQLSVALTLLTALICFSRFH